MAGLFQNFLRKLAPRSAASRPLNRSKPALPQTVASPHARTAPPPSKGSFHNGKGVELPLQPILAALPLELQPRLKHPNAGALTVCVPLEKILAQLATGAVKIPFGELRQAAPDLFTEENDRDRVLVAVPLAEVIARLNPALIKRRREQKLVEVPEHVLSPFDRRGQGLAISTAPAHPQPGPAPRHTSLVPPPAVAAPARSEITFTPPPVPPTAPPLSAPAMSAASRALGALRSGSAPAAPAPGVPAPKPAGNTDPLIISLPSLAEAWPEAVRNDIVQLNLVDAKVALPAEVVERTLKQGRVAFTWRMLRSWIRPAPLPAVSAHDSTVVELPLKIVAPLFLARQQELHKGQKKVLIDKDIPDLFFGRAPAETGNGKNPPAPQTAAPASPTASQTAAPAPTDTNYYIWDDTSDRARVADDEVKRGPTPGTKFIAKYATPNEVVSRAATLDGVAGVLIALPDGLMVASRLPADLHGDTLAAFLPQIFAKVNQCTKELRMGELNNLNFTVGNVPWKIFRVNAIFFAAFGRAGEPLPTARLAALAAELDHKPK